MSTGGPVPHGFRLAIGLVPDDIGTKVPAICLKSEGHLPRDADEVLRFKAGRRWRSIVHSARRVLLVALPPSASATRIGVANIQPERSIVPKDAAHFPE